MIACRKNNGAESCQAPSPDPNNLLFKPSILPLPMGQFVHHTPLERIAYVEVGIAVVR